MSALPQWVLDEHAIRVGHYRHDQSDEEFLQALNDALADLEANLSVPQQEPHPLIFLIGVPRAGKTLFSQVISFCLDVGYIDNLIARFWRAPGTGIRLSNIINGTHRAGAFDSDYGKTPGILGPHDFSYFWHHWLAMDVMPYDPKTAQEKIGWDTLRAELMKISAAFGRAGVFKSPNPGYHIANLSRCYSKCFFVHIVRDYIDSAVSLCKGRRDNFGSIDQWYGQWPDEYEHLLDLPYHEQIAGQLGGLNNMFERELAKINPRQVMRYSYEQLCADPRAVLKRMTSRIAEVYDCEIRWRCEPPATFACSKHHESAPNYEQLAQGLKALGLPLRQSE